MIYVILREEDLLFDKFLAKKQKIIETDYFLLLSRFMVFIATNKL